MPNTLTYDSTVLTLPDGLLWTDEHDWSPVVARAAWTITGALIVEEATRQAGRPITLASGAWLTRAMLASLQAWADTPGISMSLVYRGAAPRTVAWRRDEGAITAEPVHAVADPEAADFVRATLRFITL